MQQENRVVMDTNVIVSAAISVDGAPAGIFELFLEKKIVNYITEDIVNEAKEVMDRPFFKEHISREYKKFILESLIMHSILIKPLFDEKAVADDEADNKFINCALTAKAGIISGNKHLLDLKSYKGVKIYTPREFLGKF